MVFFHSKCILYFHVFYFALLILWGALYYCGNNSTSSLFSFSLILFVLFLMLYYKVEAISNCNIAKFWLRPSYIFLFSLIIVNLQTIINVILGYETIGFYLDTTRYSQYLGKAYYLALIAVSSFIYGNALYTKKQKEHSYTKYWGVYFWVTLTVVSCVLFIINIDIISFVTGLDYKGSGAYDRANNSSARWETIFDTFLTITVAIMTYNHSNDVKKWSVLGYIRIIPFPLLIVTIAYILLRLLSGDRGMALYTILLYVYSYIYLSSLRLKLSYLLVVLFIGAFFLTLLNYVRGYGANQSFTEKLDRGFEDITTFVKKEDVKTVSVFTQELANSVNCNFISIHDIETNLTDYKYGVYNLCEILGGVPGAATVFGKILGVDLYEYSTTEYITISFFGKYYPIGLGTTAVAAIYLDFGLLGVIIGFIIIGSFFKCIDGNIGNKNLSSIVMLIILLKVASMSIYIPRSSFAWILSRIIYILIVFSVLDIVVKTMKCILFYRSRWKM